MEVAYHQPEKDLHCAALRHDDLHEPDQHEAAQHLDELPPPHVRQVVAPEEGDSAAQRRLSPRAYRRTRAEQQCRAQDEEADRVEEDGEHRDGDDLAVVSGVALDLDICPQPRSDSTVALGECVAREGFECDVRDERVGEEHQHQQCGRRVRHDR